MNTLYRPEMLFTDGKFVTGGELLVSSEGLVLKIDGDLDPASVTVVEMPGKVLMPDSVSVPVPVFVKGAAAPLITPVMLLAVPVSVSPVSV